MSDIYAMLCALDDTPEIREDYVRAPFGYPGSKSHSLREILPHLPYRESYCEPFGGTASVLLARNASPFEVYNDRYAGVVAFYRCVRDRDKLRALVERMALYLHSREEFIWCRDTWKDCEDDVERASRWYYMMRVSFGHQGQHFGRSTSRRGQLAPKLTNRLEHFNEVHLRMRNVLIENLDWRVCLRDFDSAEMVWYMDPTYYSYSKGKYEHEMSRECHVELCERIQGLRGFVALSGYQNELYERYPWDKKVTWKVLARATGLAFSDTNNLAGHEGEISRGRVSEVLWIREAKG